MWCLVSAGTFSAHADCVCGPMAAARRCCRATADRADLNHLSYMTQLLVQRASFDSYTIHARGVVCIGMNTWARVRGEQRDHAKYTRIRAQRSTRTDFKSTSPPHH